MGGKLYKHFLVFLILVLKMAVNLNKPTVLVILGLVTLHLLWEIASIFGITQPDQTIPMLTVRYTILIIVFDIILLYALYNGHTWAWWLLLFGSIFGVINIVAAMAAGTVTGGILFFVIYIVLLLCLTKKETIDEYKPRTVIIGEGW